MTEDWLDPRMIDKVQRQAVDVDGYALAPRREEMEKMA